MYFSICRTLRVTCGCIRKVKPAINLLTFPAAMKRLNCFAAATVRSMRWLEKFLHRTSPLSRFLTTRAGCPGTAGTERVC